MLHGFCPSYDNPGYLYPGPHTARTKSTPVGKTHNFAKRISLVEYGMLVAESSEFHLMLSRAHFSNSKYAKLAGHFKLKAGKRYGAKGPCKYKKIIKIQTKFGYDTPHPPTPLSKKKKFRKISKIINHEYLYIEAITKS